MVNYCVVSLLLQLPAWPFAAASVFLGAYALIPYMCLWSPPRNPEKLPLPASELVILRATSAMVPIVLCAIAVRQTIATAPQACLTMHRLPQALAELVFFQWQPYTLHNNMFVCTI